MPDNKLFEILVCPKCKGGLTVVEGGKALVCDACRLKFPVRDGVPVMLIDEASDLRGANLKGEVSMIASSEVAFKIVAGPNRGLTFHLDRYTCKALGRAINDPNKTAMFNVDVSLALDEGTKGLIQNYVSKQFQPAGGKAQVSLGNLRAENPTGNFKRTSDVVLDDVSVSRLHCMVFYGETGAAVLDLVSKNGTFVNGSEIESRLLKKGDVIELGDTKIVFEG